MHAHLLLATECLNLGLSPIDNNTWTVFCDVAQAYLRLQKWKTLAKHFLYLLVAWMVVAYTDQDLCTVSCKQTQIGCNFAKENHGQAKVCIVNGGVFLSDRQHWHVRLLLWQLSRTKRISIKNLPGTFCDHTSCIVKRLATIVCHHSASEKYTWISAEF